MYWVSLHSRGGRARRRIDQGGRSKSPTPYDLVRGRAGINFVAVARFVEALKTDEDSAMALTGRFEVPAVCTWRSAGLLPFAS